jgi:hypothetical protein
MARCPVPGCTDPVPDEPYALFCPAHHCLLPTVRTRFLFRWQMKTARCRDDALKQHMREQMHGYVQEAVRELEAMDHG